MVADKSFSVAKLPFGTLVSWTNLAYGDRGQPFVAPHYTVRSVQVLGTFGTGGKAAIEGSLMPYLEAEIAEKVVNGSFTGSDTGWTLGAAWAYGTNAVDKNADGTNTLSQDVAVTVGKRYRVTYQITAISAGDVTPSIGGTSGTTRTAAGFYTDYLVATTTGVLAFTPSNTARFTIDDVSVMESVVWATLNDPQGNILEVTTAKVETVTEVSLQIRPHIIGGDINTLLAVHLTLLKSQ